MKNATELLKSGMSASDILTRHQRLLLLLVLAASYLLDFITHSLEMQKHLFAHRADGNAGSLPQIVVRDLADDEDSPLVLHRENNAVRLGAGLASFGAAQRHGNTPYVEKLGSMDRTAGASANGDRG
jgi:hypothetical protein